MVLTAIVIVLGIVIAIIVNVIHENSGLLGLTSDMQSATASMTPPWALIVSSLLNGYFWICNYNFYKELKGENVDPA